MAFTGLRQILIAAAVVIGLCLPAPRAEAQRSGFSFQYFIENYETMKPALVLKILSALSQTQLQLLTSFGALSQDLLRVACTVNANLYMDIQGTRTTCQMAWTDVRNALKWITQEQIRQNIRSQRNRMLIGLRCASGEIDRTSCKAFFRTLGAVANMTNDTTLRIIQNIGNQCRVGVDAGCVRY